MKAFFVLTFAALCQSAYSLREGTYMIESAKFGKSLVLTETLTHRGAPLSFDPRNGQPGQIWSFTPRDNGYWEVENHLGGNINCGTEEGSMCFAGEEPQLFMPEYKGENKYELVAKGSGYLLRVTEHGSLELAGYDDSLSEQFTLVEA
ncbi:uncharacterized protein N7498_007621 [Penicillium cinerascens]|uniref:Fascin domain-containing protein n=1 Tax=Penicillium cinerascens TaxID=70096 RepID=A0A9W9ME54_9EURO|nr:uncharacterized protein N7498_007621 [Penicillium cinerascens]KAJ5198504.1 hypothetical protein N7498_007621 [Penicillium cinerascens]